MLKYFLQFFYVCIFFYFKGVICIPIHFGIKPLRLKYKLLLNDLGYQFLLIREDPTPLIFDIFLPLFKITSANNTISTHWAWGSITRNERFIRQFQQ